MMSVLVDLTKKGMSSARRKSILTVRMTREAFFPHAQSSYDGKLGRTCGERDKTLLQSPPPESGRW